MIASRLSHSSLLLALLPASASVSPTTMEVQAQDAKKKSPGSLAQQAGNPTAPLTQVQVTNLYAPDIIGGRGHSDLLQVEPVIPIPKTRLIPLPRILRPTIPVITTTGPARTTGLGGISILDDFLPDRETWGAGRVGFTRVRPTASDALLARVSGRSARHDSDLNGTKWQLGVVLQNSVSFAGESDRPDDDWYVGLGDQTWTVDRELDGRATNPLALPVGRMVKIGRFDCNLSVEFVYTAVHDGALPVPDRGRPAGPRFAPAGMTSGTR